MEDVTVFKTWEEPMADMAVDFLRVEGINAIKLSDVPKSVFPFTVDGLGEIEIRVPEEDVEKSIGIIAVRFSEKNISDSVEDDHEDYSE